MSAWLISLEGTEAGHQLALILAVSAAFLHAVFGALQKGRHDPWLSRGAIDASYGLMAAPFALFVVPWPEPHMWVIFAGAFVIHTAYKLLQAQAYTKGAYTVVYPVVRGTGPLFAVIGAYLIFGETFTAIQWLGVAILLAGIFGLAVYNLIFLETARETLPAALMLAFATGLFVALYTTYDAYGIRATADPFTFLAWFFMIDGVAMPVLAVIRYRNMTHRPNLPPLLLRGGNRIGPGSRTLGTEVQDCGPIRHHLLRTGAEQRRSEFTLLQQPAAIGERIIGQIEHAHYLRAREG